MAIIHNITKKKASTDVTLYVYCQNSSTGAALTGLAYDTASLACYYTRAGAADAQLTLATQTDTGAHSDGGFVEIDATNSPGIYRLDLSDAVCATGVNDVILVLKGAANLEATVLNIQLVDNTAGDIVTLIGSPAADLGADIAAVKGDTAAILVDTADMQPKLGTPAADVSADIAAVKSDTAAVLTDTGTTGVATTTAIGIKKNTALANFMFVMRSSTTHDPVAGKSVTGQVSIDGAALASLTNSVSGISNGIYKVSLHADDTNGDTLLFRFSATGCDDTLIFARTQS